MMDSATSECFFVSDLHGSPVRYDKLFLQIARSKPRAVFIGGDILPTGFRADVPETAREGGFVRGYLAHEFQKLKLDLSSRYPRVFIIPGNDDPKPIVNDLKVGEEQGLWEYLHNCRANFDEYTIYGYSFVPPSPFMLKDWERYDVSRFVDPGCVSPEEGHRTGPGGGAEERYRTIAKDLAKLTDGDDLSKAIMLFHAPPYQSNLDRAALDGKTVDYAPLDVHVGSIAIQRMVQERQPLLTLHGHIHESARITGFWRDKIDRTHMFSGAHDGTELALVSFDPNDLYAARRELL